MNFDEIFGAPESDAPDIRDLELRLIELEDRCRANFERLRRAAEWRTEFLLSAAWGSNIAANSVLFAYLSYSAGTHFLGSSASANIVTSIGVALAFGWGGCWAQKWREQDRAKMPKLPEWE